MLSIFTSPARFFSFLVIILIASVAAQAQKTTTNDEFSKSFKRYDLVRLDGEQATTQLTQDGKIRFAASDRNLVLALEPNDLRSRIYRAEDTGFEGVRRLGRAPVTTYRGRIADENGSQVRLTIDGEKIEGYFISGGETFFVEPARRYHSKAPAGQLVIYKREDFLGEDGFFCPSDLDEKIEHGKTFVGPEALAGLEGPGVIELATEADLEYVNSLGGAAAANAEIMSILNMVEGTFGPELDLSIQVTYQHTWSSTDPFNGATANTLLDSFRNYWNTDTAMAVVHRDAAHLFSAKSAVLSAGIAYFGTICAAPNSAYGLSGRVDWAPAKFLVTAHELGHNLNAGHVDAPEGCTNTVMNPVITPNTNFTFCPMSRNQIGSHLTGQGNCLAPPAVQARSDFDFDGDARTDTGIFRPNGGEWWYLRSSDSGSRAFQFGKASDKIVPADFTGDGLTDVAFWRPDTGEWYVLRSEDSSFYSVPFGAIGDIPAPADYDGDGSADLAIFRPSSATWFISNSSGGTTILQHGAAGDVPVVRDYDGDGMADVAIFRPGVSEWWIRKSSGGVNAMQFGAVGDKPVPADFTGDGSADVAFWRPATGEWFVLRSEDSSYYSGPFGSAGDIPVPGDYDGDGVSDFAIWRPFDNTWYMNRSQAGFLAVTFGASGDVPVPSAFVP